MTSTVEPAGRTTEPPHTVLLGCSFAGLEFLYRTARRAGRFESGTMTVIDPRESHPYIPLVHEATASARPPESLSFDTPAFCRSLGASWITGRAVALDPERRAVTLADRREVHYDRVIIAVGSIPDVPPPFAGSPAVVPAKFLEDAVALRRRLHVLRVAGSSILRVVVVGAGITGVEWSAELAGGRVDGVRVATTLVGDEPRVLPRFRRAVSEEAAHRLSRMGVELLLHRRAVGLSRDHVMLDGGTAIPYDVIVWAGGVRPNPVLGAFGVPLTGGGAVVVTPGLAVPGREDVFAIGDCARVVQHDREWPTTMRAIEAIWQGAALARLLDVTAPPGQRRPHRLHRDFPYGLSLGPARSAIVYRRVITEGPQVVGFRRFLQLAYYRRFRRLARRLSRGDRR